MRSLAITAAAASALGLITGSVLAGDVAQPSSTPSSSVSDPLICKRVTQTGSHIPTKQCKKQSEWDALRKEGKDIVEGGQRRQVNPTGS